MWPVWLGLRVAAPSRGPRALLFSVLMLNPFKRQIDLIFLWNIKVGSKLLVITSLGVPPCTTVTYKQHCHLNLNLVVSAERMSPMCLKRWFKPPNFCSC